MDLEEGTSDLSHYNLSGVLNLMPASTMVLFYIGWLAGSLFNDAFQ
jgi:hypothetical protein